MPYFETFVERKFITGLFDNKIKMAGEKRAKILWLIFALEVWHKKVYMQYL